MISHGYSLVELMLVMGLSVTLGAVAVPQSLAGLDEARAEGAARHLAGRFQRARIEAVMRSASVAVQFSPDDGSYSFGMFVDGNRNGVLSRDIQRGLDYRLGAGERLRDQFSGVEFGALPGLPAVDTGGTPPGADPIRLGASSMVSFSPSGTSSSGSVYIRGRRNTQFVVRVFGETGKTRVLRFDGRSRQWKPL